MNSEATLLIIGASHAGVELAFAARQQGWTGPVTLIGAENSLPYQRPPLSKAYLSGTATDDSLQLRPAQAYAEADVTLRPGVRVEQIDRLSRTVRLCDGSTLAYTKLALCTGGRPRTVIAEGMRADATPPNLHYLRTRADADGIRGDLRQGARLVVIGGGYVGLEVAASARKLGAEVTVLEAQHRVLARVTGPELSAFYETIHREAGVTIRTGVAVQRIICSDTGAVEAVACSDGTTLEADVVLAGIGMLPNVELAQAAGLDVDGGIVVNEFSGTSDPDIVAAGDCTVHDSALYGRRIRLESVPNALEQARAAAAVLCGKPRANGSIPWFWSDQYDLKLQMVGLSEGYDRCILRGAVETRSFCAFYLRDGMLIAADAVNRPMEFMLSKRAVGKAGPLDVEALADASIPLKEVLAPQPRAIV
ncbi:FAD-dependent oxidoreductase [Paraburkholderia sp. USG1]|uniref:NAD(P)/FAD-dependent oxidoreductase n=1 Tax=Paraburkholderia sp. USG1 TaxID=2952268 RepID=UPI002865D884|nr:FAD-dependent oxidoreductase [Paraburkholderia sp. USG1]MDR8394719.1 FAD-dependent oxidoreductase [Paraburkholderia sp. USG1]